jgi:Tfp pilus assembly ATPase PilU
MVSVKEILVANEQISQIIYSGNIEELYPIMQRNRKIGLQTMEQDLLGYIKTGQIAVEIAMEAANRAKLLKDLMQYASS